MFVVPMRPKDVETLVALYADRMPAAPSGPRAAATIPADVQVPVQRRADGLRRHLPRFASRR
jgi:hypothetical protein